MKYPWWDRWQSLRNRPLPQAKAELALSIAASFIEEYAAESEVHGWQPIHIMRPFTGLAWAWPELPVVSTRPRLMAATIKPFDFIYKPNRNGTFSRVVGAERHRALMTFGLPGEYTQ